MPTERLACILHAEGSYDSIDSPDVSSCVTHGNGDIDVLVVVERYRVVYKMRYISSYLGTNSFCVKLVRTNTCNLASTTILYALQLYRERTEKRVASHDLHLLLYYVLSRATLVCNGTDILVPKPYRTQIGGEGVLA